MQKSINVLSLFDGISCGQLALKRAGIIVDNYYASEIDKHAITVTTSNFPNTIQLGDVTKWKTWNIDWNNIDLLLAGFPCQAWSFAGKQRGTDDPRGALAIVLCDIYTFIKEKNPKLKFLFENVKMKKEHEHYLNDLFKTKPIEIDSALISAQRRKRLYWTNIKTSHPSDKNLHVKDIREHGAHYTWISSEKTKHRVLSKNYVQYDINNLGNRSQSQRACYMNGKSLTLDTTSASNAKVLDGEEIRLFTLKECERLQTLPDDYTISIKPNKAKAAIGNGWTVDVIAHILSSLNTP